MTYQNVTFFDEATGIPVIVSVMPEGFTCKAVVETRNSNGETEVKMHAEAFDAGNTCRLYLGGGESYTAPQPGKPVQAQNVHPLCSVEDQLDEYARKLVGQNISSAAKYQLPPERMQKVQISSQEYNSFSLETANQVARMSQIPLALQLSLTIQDGAMGIYSFEQNGVPSTLYIELERIGCGITTTAQGMFGFMGTQTNITSWSIPTFVYCINEGPMKQETADMFLNFIRHLDYAPEYQNYVRQITLANTQYYLNVANQSMQQTQAINNMLNAQQEASWARVDAMRKSLSQDLDQFRASQAENARAMDSFRAGLHSTNTPMSSFGMSETETMDDRIQRLRHETIAGVNTYDREDGTTYEHSIMDNRVFESNYDSNVHVGTENYHDDYVPDNWTELKRKM